MIMLSATDKRRAGIRRRYDTARRDRKREPVSLAALRVGDLKRLFVARYGHELPDDDAGRDDALIMAHHLARQPNAERRIPAWLGLNAPWMNPREARDLTAKVLAKPLRWRADKLARRLNLHEAERQRLRITTIGAVDLDKAERKARRKLRARQRKEERRRAKGAKPRAEYEARSLTRTKPWEALGMSRRTWYRRGTKPTRGTSPATA
jgi:hypothetical protein